MVLRPIRVPRMWKSLMLTVCPKKQTVVGYTELSHEPPKKWFETDGPRCREKLVGRNGSGFTNGQLTGSMLYSTSSMGTRSPRKKKALCYPARVLTGAQVTVTRNPEVRGAVANWADGTHRGHLGKIGTRSAWRWKVTTIGSRGRGEEQRRVLGPRARTAQLVLLPREDPTAGRLSRAQRAGRNLRTFVEVMPSVRGGPLRKLLGSYTDSRSP